MSQMNKKKVLMLQDLYEQNENVILFHINSYDQTKVVLWKTTTHEWKVKQQKLQLKRKVLFWNSSSWGQNKYV